MIKGFRFTNQLANAEIDARIHQEFLNKNDGIFYGMELNNTNNTITISEGLCEIAGRPVAIVDYETVTVSMDSLYCLLVMEVDLSKETTVDMFEQVKFKILESSIEYPKVTQQDINVYNGEKKIYQLEFARFKTSTSGILDFKDTRSFLNFNGIYAQVIGKCKDVIEQIRQELKDVEDGSAYLLRSDLQLIFPIGSTYITQTNINPCNILGFGIWERFKAKIALGLDEDDPDFNQIGKTGGEKEHILTVKEMPSHNHTIKIKNNGATGLWQIKATNATGENGDHPTESVGENQPHNNMQPFEINGYMWIRRA